MEKLSPRKSLGQHFLHDRHWIDRILALAGDLSSLNIIEIGPGTGNLTQGLLKRTPLSMHAIEKDDRCLPGLQALQALHPPFHLHPGDALALDLPSLVPAPRAIVANLPYNVSTQLLVRWLEDIHKRQPYAFLLLMFQKEVAERLCALPGNKDYGRLSVLTQWLCRVEKGFDIPPGAFTPPPKVISSVLKLTPRPQPLFSADKAALETVLAAAFGQRRKMLRSALRSLGVNSAALLEADGINPTLRAEQLIPEQFGALARAFVDIKYTM